MRRTEGKGTGTLMLEGTLEKRGVCMLRYEQILGMRPPMTGRINSMNLTFNNFNTEKFYIQGRLKANKPGGRETPKITFNHFVMCTPDHILQSFTNMLNKPFFQDMNVPPQLYFDEEQGEFILTLPPFSSLAVEDSHNPQAIPVFPLMGFPYDKTNPSTFYSIENNTDEPLTLRSNNAYHMIDEPLETSSSDTYDDITTTVPGKNVLFKKVTVSFNEDRQKRSEIVGQIDILANDILELTGYEVDDLFGEYLNKILQTLNIPTNSLLCENGVMKSADVKVKESVEISFSPDLIALLRCNTGKMTFNLNDPSPREFISYHGTLNLKFNPKSLFPLTVIAPGTTPNTYVQNYGQTCVLAQYDSDKTMTASNDFIIHQPSGYFEFLFLNEEYKPHTLKRPISVSMIVKIRDQPFMSKL